MRGDSQSEALSPLTGLAHLVLVYQGLRCASPLATIGRPIRGYTNNTPVLELPARATHNTAIGLKRTRTHFTTGTNFTQTHLFSFTVVPVSLAPPVFASSSHTPTFPPS